MGKSKLFHVYFSLLVFHFSIFLRIVPNQLGQTFTVKSERLRTVCAIHGHRSNFATIQAATIFSKGPIPYVDTV